MKEVEDVRGTIVTWLKDKSSDITQYLTPEGIAFANGYTIANNTIKLIPYEDYDTLLKKYEELINKYEKLKNKKNKFF